MRRIPATRFDDDALFASADATTPSSRAQVSGSLDTRDGRMDGKAHVRKRLFSPAKSSPLVPDRADIGLTYETKLDDVRYGARGAQNRGRVAVEGWDEHGDIERRGIVRGETF